MPADHDPVQLPASHIPVPLTPLVNRERELTAAQASLRDRNIRLLTLTGTGGVGKTRLASELALSLASEFEDGVHFVPLAGVRDPALVAPTIARMLGIREIGDRPVAETLIEQLPQRDALVVLDNFEQVDAAAPLLSDLLAAGSGLRMVVTSRSVLRVAGEHHMPVLPLAFPNLDNLPPLVEIAATAAVRLFVERARAATGSFTLTAANAPDVVAICARLDGLPLAIQLAAARLRHLPLPVIAERLRRSLSLLVGGPRDSPERQQALRATINWSYELLTPGDQALFRRLAVFVGGWTLESAEAVTAGPHGQEFDVLDGISALIDNSLIVQTPVSDASPRYGMLETIREFGLEQLQASGGRDVTERLHSAYFLEMSVQAREMIDGPHQADWLGRLADDHDNLRSVLERSLERGNAVTALLLSVSLWGFWAQRGFLRQGRRTLERALRIAEDVDPTLRGRAIYCLGLLALDLNDLAEAEAHLSSSLAIWREMRDQDRIAAASVGLGATLRDLGEYEEATGHFEEALAIWTTLDDASGIASAKSGLGTVAFAEGDYQRAHSLHEQALAIRQAAGDADGAAYSIWALADAARLQNMSSLAESRYREGLATFERFGDRQGKALMLHGLALLAYQTGDDLEALRLFQEALTLNRSLSARNRMVECIEGIAATVCRRGYIGPAVSLLGATATLRAALAPAPRVAERIENEQTLGFARRTLTATEFEVAWESGQALSLDEATAEALALTENPEALSRPASPFNLTRREQEVLSLLCQHLTDAEIAEKLYLSTRTASNHVANILGKLGVDNRREAIAFATQHGLV